MVSFDLFGHCFHFELVWVNLTANSDEGTMFLTRGVNFDSDMVNAIIGRNGCMFFRSTLS